MTGVLELWFPLMDALTANDDLAIARLYDRHSFGGTPLLTLEQHARCELALRRAETYQLLIAALKHGDDSEIAQFYDETLLGLSSIVPPLMAERVARAKKRVQLLTDLDGALAGGDPEEIADAVNAAWAEGLSLDGHIAKEAIWEALDIAYELKSLREYINSQGGELQILRSGISLWEHSPHLLTMEESRRIERAVQVVGEQGRPIGRSCRSSAAERVTESQPQPPDGQHG